KYYGVPFTGGLTSLTSYVLEVLLSEGSGGKYNLLQVTSRLRYDVRCAPANHEATALALPYVFAGIACACSQSCKRRRCEECKTRQQQQTPVTTSYQLSHADLHLKEEVSRL